MNVDIFESWPIVGIFIIVAVWMIIFNEIGYQYGMRKKSSKDKEASSTLGPMVGGMLGMLAFVLALTFSIVSTQHEIRKQNVIDDANAIGTAYRRADLMDVQYKIELKRLFAEYVDIRIKAAEGVAEGRDITNELERTIKIHDLLWDQVFLAAKDNPNTNTSLMIQSVNEVIDMHEKRMMGAFSNKIPDAVWIALMSIIALTMLTLGSQIGYNGKRRFTAVFTMVLAFTVLVTIAVDLNRAGSGFIIVDQQPMINLQNSISPVTK